MQYSIKEPSAFLWKTGYTEEKIRSYLQGGRITGDCLICRLGEATQAVTVTEFIDNPSILNQPVHLSGDQSSNLANQPQPPLSVAALGWLVFFGGLATQYFVTAIMSNRVDGITRSIDNAVFAATLLKGIDALVIAGAITALLGHAHRKMRDAEQANSSKDQ